MVQLFFNALMVDFVFACFNAPDISSATGGGRRGRGSAAEDAAERNAFRIDQFSKIDLVGAHTTLPMAVDDKISGKQLENCTCSKSPGAKPSECADLSEAELSGGSGSTSDTLKLPQESSDSPMRALFMRGIGSARSPPGAALAQPEVEDDCPDASSERSGLSGECSCGSEARAPRRSLSDPSSVQSKLQSDDGKHCCQQRQDFRLVNMVPLLRIRREAFREFSLNFSLARQAGRRKHQCWSNDPGLKCQETRLGKTIFMASSQIGLQLSSRAAPNKLKKIE
ncbi:MAG: hypothetical protein SGPRY_005060 [Prymnesium sp.]